MDLDAYTAAHRDEWDRLAQLGRNGRLTGQEADELIDRYQSGASQLSAIRSTAGESLQGERLSLHLSRARLRFTGTSANVLSRMPDFFVRQVPAALYRIRWTSLIVTVISLLIGLVYYLWFSGEPRILATLADEAGLEQYAKEDFVNYYSEYSGTSFTSVVWTNNAWLATQAVAFGIIGVYTPYLVFANAASIGQTAAIMDQYDRLDVFFLFILPHGQLELYAIFVAGAAGMAIFWSWISPGSKTRLDALAAGGRSLIIIAVGLTLALLMSGLVEGFVTRQPWPPAIKIGIGTLALLSFLAYQWILGGRAHRAGITGDLDEFEGGAKTLTAG